MAMPGAYHAHLLYGSWLREATEFPSVHITSDVKIYFTSMVLPLARTSMVLLSPPKLRVAMQATMLQILYNINCTSRVSDFFFTNYAIYTNQRLYWFSIFKRIKIPGFRVFTGLAGLEKSVLSFL